MNVLLSIKPEFAEKILTSQKKYEFRKTPISKADSVENVILYASSPAQRIVGSFEINQITSGSPSELWEQYGDASGIEERNRFMQYYSGKQEGYAIEIGNPRRLLTAVDPTEVIDDFTPPVSFQYVNGEFDSVLEQGTVEPSVASD